MKIGDALAGISIIFLDTAPVIYFVERNPEYHHLADAIFARIDDGSVAAVTSPITLLECLVVPYRLGLAALQQDYVDMIVSGFNTTFVHINDAIARHAAELRARYNLTLLDAMQIAAAVGSGCDAFLTNDAQLRRVTDIQVLVLSDLEI